MNRRRWLQQGGMLVGAWLAAERVVSANSSFRPGRYGGSAPAPNSHFKLSVITDEITQDFGHALEVAAKEFGLGYVEIRTLWNKNIVNLDEKAVAEVRRLLDNYSLKVTDIASPLFKVQWPGAPQSEYASEPGYQSDFSFEQQDEVLERATAVAKRLGTDRVRCFDFWRL